MRQTNPFTKPNLELLTSTPAKDPATSAASTGAANSAENPNDPSDKAEVFAGLDVDSLKKKYEQQPQLGELLQTELEMTGQDLQTSPVSKVLK